MNKLLKLYHSFMQSKLSILLVLIPIVAAIYVHSPIVSYDFKYDDYVHFYDAANLRTLEFLLKPWGGHLQIVLNTFICFFYMIFAFNAKCYFVFVLFTHVINVFFLFHIIKYLTQKEYLAVFGASLWGICPINQGSLGWFSVYSHVLSATWIFWVLFDVVRIKYGKLVFKNVVLIKWYLLLILASASFGTGFAIASLFAPLAWFILKNHEEQTKITIRLLPLVIVIPTFYLFIHWLYSTISGVTADIPSFQAFNPSNWYDMGKLFFYTMSYAVSTLLLGPFIVYGENSLIFTPFKMFSLSQVLGLSCMMFIIFTLVFFWIWAKSDGNKRSQMSAFIFIVVITFGIITLGRILLIKAWALSIDSYSLSPRYYYIGPMSIAIVLCLMFEWAVNSRIIKEWKCLLILFIWLVVLVVPAKNVGMNVEFDHGYSSREVYKREILKMQDKILSYPAGATVYIKNERVSSITILFNDGIIFPNLAALFMIEYPENIVCGRRVYFIEDDIGIANNLTKRRDTRIADLIVTHDMVPIGTE